MNLDRLGLPVHRSTGGYLHRGRRTGSSEQSGPLFVGLPCGESETERPSRFRRGPYVQTLRGSTHQRPRQTRAGTFLCQRPRCRRRKSKGPGRCRALNQLHLCARPHASDEQRSIRSPTRAPRRCIDGGEVVEPVQRSLSDIICQMLLDKVAHAPARARMARTSAVTSLRLATASAV